MRDQMTVRGVVETRPWRVGLLIDIRDADKVREAISSLASVWGGRYLPILDSAASEDELIQSGRRYGLDSLYTEDDVAPDVGNLLRVPGYLWRGRRRWGPFATADAGLSKGLLRSEEIRGWAVDEPPSKPQSLLEVAFRAGGSGFGPAADDHLHLRNWYGHRPPSGFFVVDESAPSTVVDYWNEHALGGALLPLSDRSEVFNARILERARDFALTLEAAQIPLAHGDRLDADRKTQFWTEMRSIGSRVVDSVPAAPDDVRGWFAGFEPVASRRFSVTTESASPRITVPIPRLPFLKRSDHHIGIIAAEVHALGDEGLDPRLTLAIPPHRRHAKLLEPSLAFGSDHVRVSGRGAVFAVQGGADEVTVPIPSNLEVMRLLFDDPNVQVSQSNEGRFQSRSAEILGGTTGAAATHPGLRAAITRIGRQSGGVTLQEIRSTIEKERGDWPDDLFTIRSKSATTTYVDQMTNFLLNSGLVVPMMDVQCSFCRVTSHIEASALSSKPHCEFCGHEFSLALSLALTKPTWRYRLAGHIAANKVEPMLPVVASLATLSQLRSVEGPRIASVLGLEVDLPGQGLAEVDIAAVLHEDSWIVVLGEVKSHNRIDDIDVDHLGSLQRYLWTKDVQSVVLFATLKEEFLEVERQAIRRVADANARFVRTRHPGVSTVVTPLVWTRRDISLPWGSDEHPWHWGRPGDGLGIYGVAQESCRRHLQLTGWRATGVGEQAELRWTDSKDPVVDGNAH